MKKNSASDAEPRDRAMEILAARSNDDLRFEPAHEDVVGGHELASSGNRFYGKQVYISSGNSPVVDLKTVVTGQVIRVGAIQQVRRGVLLCLRDGDRVTVGIYDKNGWPLCRVLSCVAPGEDELDEGRLVYLGPKELYCTPWSDGGAAVCQVVTVEALRRWGSQAQIRKKK
jgi:hypothetical protein